MSDYKLAVEVIGRDALSGPFGAATGALDHLGARAGVAHAALLGLQTALVAVGAVSGTLAAGLGASVAAAAGFEKTMSGVKAVSNATASEMKQLSALALQLGKDTSFSASQAAAGLEELVKGGVSIPDIMNGAAQATLNLAAAGGVSLPEAAEIASNAINQFSLSGENMAHVSDLIAGAANASSISVGDFRQSLAQAGVAMNAAGQTFDSTATSIALLGAAGIKGSDAGTSLRVMFSRLLPQTKDQETAFKALNLQTGALGNAFLNADGSFKQASEIAAILHDRTANLTQAEKTLALQMIFGEDAKRAAIVLADKGAEGYAKLSGEMEKVTAAEVAKTRLDNLSGSLEQLRGSAETAGIAIGSGFLPVVREGIDKLTQTLNDAIPQLQEYQERLEDAFATGGFDAWLAELGNVAGDIGQQVEGWGPAFGAFIDPAKQKAGETLEELWTGTIAPWIEQKKNELGDKFTDEWVPALTTWLEKDAQPEIRKQLNLLADSVVQWAETDGAHKFEDAAGRLATAFLKRVSIIGQVEPFLNDAISGWNSAHGIATPAERAAGYQNYNQPSPTTATPNGSTDYRAAAAQFAALYGLDPNIFIRQINQESGFRTDRTSSAGARGIAQFMPGTGAGVAAQLGISEDAFWGNPLLQLQGAAHHMRQLLDMFGGDYTRALAGYNAGPGAVQSGDWLGYGETRRYVSSILGSEYVSAAQSGSRAPSPISSSTRTPGGGPTDIMGLLNGGGATNARSKKAGEEAAANFGDGFMKELQKSTATFEAYFGETGGKVASALAASLAESIPNSSSEATLAKAMEDLITKAREAGVPEWRETGDELAGAILTAITERTPEARAAAMDMIAQVAASIKQANALTPESFMAALGMNGLEGQMGQRGASIMHALEVAVDKGGAQNIKALAGTVEQMRVALLSDDKLDPADAQAKFESVMDAVTTAIQDGSPAALAQLQRFLSDFNRELQTSQIAENAAKLANVAIQTAQEQITKIFATAEEARKNLYTNLAITQWDRSQQKQLDDWLTAYLESTQKYIDKKKEERQDFRETEQIKRQEIEETAAAEKSYQDARQKLLDERKKVGDMSGVYAPTRHVDPADAINQQLKDLDKAHKKEMDDLKDKQAQRRKDRDEDKTWQKEDKDYYESLDKDVLKPAQKSAAQIKQDWQDWYQEFVTIPREVNKLTTKTAEDVDTINKGLATALEKYSSDADTALARVNALHENALPLVKSAGDTALSKAAGDAAAMETSARNTYYYLKGQEPPGASNAAGYVTGATSPYTTGSGGARGTGAGGPGGTFGNNGPILPPSDPGEGGDEGSPSSSDFTTGALFSAGNETFPEQLNGPTASGAEGGGENPGIDKMRAQMTALVNGMIETKLYDFSALQAMGWDFSKVQKLEVKGPTASNPLPVEVVKGWPQPQPYSFGGMFSGAGQGTFGPPTNPYDSGLGVGGSKGGGGLGGEFPHGSGGGTGGDLPHFASGVRDFPGGWAIVGEQGPEPVYLPSGSSVYPHGTGPAGGQIDYDRLAQAVASQMTNISVQMDRQPVGRLMRTDDRYHRQSNLPDGVGALVPSR